MLVVIDVFVSAIIASSFMQGMQNMTELVSPSTSRLIDEDVKPGQNAETTADLSSIVTDQLRVSAEEVDFEVQKILLNNNICV